MSLIDKIINDEFGTIAVERIVPDETIEKVYKKYVTKELDSDDLETVASCLYDARYNSFAQGFMRGIAVAKGGVI